MQNTNIPSGNPVIGHIPDSKLETVLIGAVVVRLTYNEVKGPFLWSMYVFTQSDRY
jgi:hypothetical protein